MQIPAPVSNKVVAEGFIPQTLSLLFQKARQILKRDQVFGISGRPSGHCLVAHQRPVQPQTAHSHLYETRQEMA